MTLDCLLDQDRIKRSIAHASASAMLLVLIGAPIAIADVPHELSISGGPPAKTGMGMGSPSWSGTVLVGGDNAASAVVIPGLPYTDSGNTCTFNDDYALPCGPGSSSAPDVVYRFTPTSPMCVNISLCQSDYDAALYVWENGVGNVVACNDDACGPTGQQSRIAGLQLLAGNTYFIVVDGFGTQPPGSVGCGNYEIRISECLPSCTPLPCPPGALSEGEQVCSTGYVDQTNGGCNSAPSVFTTITCPTTICGQYGKYCSDALFCFSVFRDTDWYQLEVEQALTFHLCVQGDIPTQVDVVDANAGCPGTIVPGTLGFPLACEDFCQDVSVAAGKYWIFVAPQQDPTFPLCTSRYVLSLSSAACTTTPTQRLTWGKLKSVYR